MTVIQTHQIFLMLTNMVK